MEPAGAGVWKAEGNFICASPPYLSQSTLNVKTLTLSVQRGDRPNGGSVSLLTDLKKARVAHWDTSRSHAALEQARIREVAQACSSCNHREDMVKDAVHLAAIAAKLLIDLLTAWSL